MTQRHGRRNILLTGLVAVIGLTVVDQLPAQFRTPIAPSFKERRRSTISPYTSLINNGGGGGSLNYFNIVKPVQNQQRLARNLSEEIRSVDSRFEEMAQPKNETASPGGLSASPSEIAISSGRMAPTGHRTSFGDARGYFSGGTGRR